MDHHLNASVAAQFEAFATGFRMLCDGPALRLFNCQVRGVGLACESPTGVAKPQSNIQAWLHSSGVRSPTLLYVMPIQHLEPVNTCETCCETSSS